VGICALLIKETIESNRHAARAGFAHVQNTRSGMWSQPDPLCGADYRPAKTNINSGYSTDEIKFVCKI